MWRDVRTLWRWRWRVLQRTSLGINAMIFLGLPMGGPLAFLVGWQVARDAVLPMRPLLYPLLALAFLLLQAFLVGSTLTRALFTLYRENDLDLLLSSPVRPAAVFLERFLELLVFPGLALTALVVAFFWGMGVGLQMGLFYYPLLLVAALWIPCIPTALSVIVLLVLVRYVPPWRLEEGLVGLGMLLLLGYQLMVWFGAPAWAQAVWRWVQGWLVGANAAGFWATAPAGWPTNWAAWAVVAAGLGRPSLALGPLAAFAAVSLAAVGLGVVLALRLYLTGWTRLGVVPAQRRPRRHPGWPRFSTWTARPVGAILRKDVTLLRRDPQRLYALVWPVLYVVGFIFARQGNAWRTVRVDTGLNLGWAFYVLGLGFVLAMTAWPFHLFHNEEKTLWLLRSAPVSAQAWLMAKFGMALAPTLLVGLGTALGVAWGLRFGPRDVAQAVGLALIQSVGVSALAASLTPPVSENAYEGSNDVDRFLYIAGYLLITDTVLLLPLQGLASPTLQAAIQVFKVAFLVGGTWWIVQASFRMTVKALQEWEVL